MSRLKGECLRRTSGRNVSFAETQRNLSEFSSFTFCQLCRLVIFFPVENDNVFSIGVDYGVSVLTLCSLSHPRMHYCYVIPVKYARFPYHKGIRCHSIYCYIVWLPYASFNSCEKNFTVFSFPARPSSVLRHLGSFTFLFFTCRYLTIYIFVLSCNLQAVQAFMHMGTASAFTPVVLASTRQKPLPQPQLPQTPQEPDFKELDDPEGYDNFTDVL